MRRSRALLRMLVELHIENLAVAERLRIPFGPGLNLLTGETGSGKSIIVDSLGLLFGGRASAEMVRSGTDRARVSGLFDLSSSAEVNAILEEAGIPAEDGELLVEREILANGKSRAFIASRPVTVAVLRQLAPWLGDIHGQNEQQRLNDAAAQRELLDAFGGTADAVARTAEIFSAWKECDRELDEIAQREQEQLRLADLWSFQAKEIDAVDPRPGEDADLENEKRVLQNVTRLAEHAETAFDALYDAPHSALAQVRSAAKHLEELARIDSALAETADSLRPALIAIEEAGRTLRDYTGHLEADPARLEEVESRLAAIDRLRRKYGSTIEEIRAFSAEVHAKMRTVETASERRAAIEQRRSVLAGKYDTAAAALTALRQKAAKSLAKRVETELKALAMGSTTFRAAIEEAPWSAHGRDAVTFLVSANRGEEPRELAKVASGGEISRIALAIKTCIERERPAGAPYLLVFDEVDAGIGGEAAESVGRRLKELSRANQVLCVTHQAQIASFADQHFRVEKFESKGRTSARAVLLVDEERTREIGRMLSGQLLTPEALRHAEQLLRAGAAV